jgi:hypothetical protein
MKCGTGYIVEFLQKLLRHEDRDRILAAIDDGLTIKDSHQKGQAFEVEVEEMARGRGLPVEPGDGSRATDRIIHGWRVQAKHIDQLKGRRVTINNMRPVLGNSSKRCYMADEVDFVVLKHLGQLFIIPGALLEQPDGTLATTVDPHQLASCVDAWAPLSKRGPHGTAQQELF